MSGSEDGIAYTYCKSVPSNKPDEEASPEDEISVTVEEELEDDYTEEYNMTYFEEPKRARFSKQESSAYSHIRKKNERISRIRNNVNVHDIDVIDLGKSVVLCTVDNSLKSAGVEKAVKAGVADTNYLGDVSIEALVHGLMAPDAFDARFAMVGNAVMWNVLKSNMRDVKSTILMRTTQSYSEPRFDGIDLHAANLPQWQRTYDVRAVGVFANADLHYVFSLLTFRTNAKLLNKTKQFLKAYFIVACRPRCMIWRYTLRRSGASHKKAILNMPPNIVQTIIYFLLDLTGIGQAETPYETLDPSTPFYQSLGEDEEIRETRYLEMYRLKDSLANFFRDAITDCLNEIREMPFCLTTGNLISPLRGRPTEPNCVTWKEYETILKTEHDCPSKPNTLRRVEFEQQLCQVIPRR